jgi:hypothetical protein
MPASHSLETVFVRFDPFLIGDIFTGYRGACVTPTVVQLCFAKLSGIVQPEAQGRARQDVPWQKGNSRPRTEALT